MIAAGTVVHVIQGEFAVSPDPDVVMTTVLGSCISACLCDPVRRVGGMNHFLLPDGDRTSDSADLRFASAAMEQLVNALLKAGAERGRLRAKLFGGARIMAGLPDIGRRNAEAALAFLAGEGIACVSMSVGGNDGRRIRFWPTTGRARQLLLGAGEAAPPSAARLSAGPVELF